MHTDTMVGLEGTITGACGPSLVGQASVGIRGGSEVFYIRTDDELPLGTEIIVTDYYPPRTIAVKRKDPTQPV